MAELTQSREYREGLVKISDIEDSEYGGLIIQKQNLFATDTRERTLGRWLSAATQKMLNQTGRTLATLGNDAQLWALAKETVVHLVGIRICRRAQLMRIKIEEVNYQAMITEAEKEIATNYLNLRVQTSGVAITNAEPGLYDSDADYSDDDSGGAASG